MLRLVRQLITFCAIAALPAAVADSIAPSNDTVVAAANGTGVTIQFSKNVMLGSPFSILPLTTAATSMVSGQAVVMTPSNAANISQQNIVFLSCDPSAYGGFLGPIGLFDSAQERGVPAVIFYSNTSDWCKLQLDNGAGSTRAYSSRSRNDTRSILALIQNHQFDDPNYVTITSPNGPASTGNSSSGGGDYAGPLGGSPSPGTAVAMIVLYAITGVITLLFLMIIITGAVRAHRHPERYGPLNGRIRRTRAGGIARAVLDSIPVVKFGERQQPKPTDVELAPASAAGPDEIAPAASALPADGVAQVDEKSPAVAVTEGIAAADGAAKPPEDEEHGCSICTEDFEVGQDQRVLPCNHRFHPACVDPWLLNVSGTCPLCRINLHPPAEDSTAEDQTEAPPLNDAAPTADRRRRSVLMAITGLHRLDSMSRDERITALRRYRLNRSSRIIASEPPAEADETAIESTATAPAPETTENESRLRQRLSRVLNVRTWRTGQS